MTLHPCRSCRRHLRPSAVACPFCDAAVASPRSVATVGAAAALALALGACGTGQSAPVDPQPVTSDAQPVMNQAAAIDAGAAEQPPPPPAPDAAAADPDEVQERLKMPYGAPPVRTRLV